jgi:sulfite exporter TauE/SafE
MDLWIAFTVGLFGSLHCAGMCGPLALALPRSSGGRASLLAGRLLYNAGRTATYAAIGASFGLAGQTLLLTGAQRWLSIGLGTALLLGYFSYLTPFSRGHIAKFSGFLSRWMAPLFKNPAAGNLAVLGLLNGLLPCGLVYVAATGAAATGSALSGAAYMTAFGVGTIPMMLAISLSGNLVPIRLRLRLLKAVPAVVICVAALLIMRGLSLGIPYISPILETPGSCCGH